MSKTLFTILFCLSATASADEPPGLRFLEDLTKIDLFPAISSPDLAPTAAKAGDFLNFNRLILDSLNQRKSDKTKIVLFENGSIKTNNEGKGYFEAGESALPLGMLDNATYARFEIPSKVDVEKDFKHLKIKSVKVDSRPIKEQKNLVDGYVVKGYIQHLTFSAVTAAGVPIEIDFFKKSDASKKTVIWSAADLQQALHKATKKDQVLTITRESKADHKPKPVHHGERSGQQKPRANATKTPKKPSINSNDEGVILDQQNSSPPANGARGE